MNINNLASEMQKQNLIFEAEVECVNTT